MTCGSSQPLATAAARTGPLRHGPSADRAEDLAGLRPGEGDLDLDRCRPSRALGDAYGPHPRLLTPQGTEREQTPNRSVDGSAALQTSGDVHHHPAGLLSVQPDPQVHRRRHGDDHRERFVRWIGGNDPVARPGRAMPEAQLVGDAVGPYVGPGSKTHHASWWHGCTGGRLLGDDDGAAALRVSLDGGTA